MYKNILLIITACALYSCGGEKQQPTNQVTITEPEKVVEDHTLVISTFDTVPDEIDGCSCAFASDSIAYKANHLLFADDIGDIAYMKINGKMVRLTQSEHATKENDSTIIDSTATHALYKAKGIEVILDTQKGRNIDTEVWEETGTIKIKQEDGQTIKRAVYGSCGC
ncbi:hypothetical protein ACLI09_17255 [Flavobacterium sp. RHBU_24]|uniref:hypothetical protein n=1 Tax=Flavobacterium sp. RHBU_24 TaxID=3391185 RepID=UPI003984EDA3